MFFLAIGAAAVLAMLLSLTMAEPSTADHDAGHVDTPATARVQDELAVPA